MPRFWQFGLPEDSQFTLKADNGFTGVLGIETHPTGRPGHVVDVPLNKVNGGASLDQVAKDFDSFHGRGLLILNPDDSTLCGIMFDDIHLNKSAVVIPPVPVPIPGPSQHPLVVISNIAVASDLTTKEGCGKFLEKCVTALHLQHSNSYGHIHKVPPQNNYNGHAVDALTLETSYKLLDGTVIEEGVYDIVTNSESSDAKPAFNRAGTHLPGYYPA